MKVEYVCSAMGESPDLKITASEFEKAYESEEEYCALIFAVDGFATMHRLVNDLTYADLDLTKEWLKENGSGNVLFVARKDDYHHARSIRWGEIYIMAGGKIIDILTSQDGKHFEVNKKEIEGDDYNE